jgi:hypothetical protein
MKGLSGFSWHKKLDELPCLRSNQADVFQLAFENSIMGDAEILGCPFDSDKIYHRMPLSGVDQKASFTGTYLDFHGVDITEHSFPVQNGIIFIELV